MPSVCKFTFRNKKPVYFAGQSNVAGMIDLETTYDKKVKEIKISFKGVIRCTFDEALEAENQGCMPGSNLPSSKFVMFKEEKHVYDAGALPAGKYSWSFDFPVDITRPTSMECRIGHIRYELSLRIYNEGKYSNIFHKPITIIGADNVNSTISLRFCVEIPVYTYKLCGVLESGPHFEIKTAYGAYAPGQFLIYTLQIYKRAITSYKIKFIRKTTFKAKDPERRTELEDTVSYYKGEVRGFKSIEHALFIPCTPPTMSTENVDVAYTLQVTAKTQCCLPKLKGELPIVVGTVPLREGLTPPQRQAIFSSHDPPIITPGCYQSPDPYYTPDLFRPQTAKKQFIGFMPLYPMYYMRSTV